MTPNLETTIRQWCAESEGWTGAERCLEMAQLVLDAKPKTVVEIGVFGGRSLICQALALKQNEYGVIYGIDPWKKDCAVEGYDASNPDDKANRDWWLSLDIHDIHKKAIEAVWRFQLDKHAVLIRSSSQDCQHVFGKFPCIDILFVDGNHSEVASCRDAECYLPRVLKGGHVWLDDCDWPTTQKMQAFVQAQCNLIKDTTSDGHRYKLFQKR